MDNTTIFTSPLASVNHGPINVPPQVEYVVDAISNISFWTAFWTLLALAVLYDQRMSCCCTPKSRRRALTNSPTQSAISGTRALLSGLHGRYRLWDHFSNP